MTGALTAGAVSRTAYGALAHKQGITPVHFCGSFGHKPAHDVVPLRGHLPPLPGVTSELADLAVSGSLARSSEDLLLAMKVLGVSVAENAAARRWALPPARKKSIREYRIRYALEHPLCPVTAVERRD